MGNWIDVTGIREVIDVRSEAKPVQWPDNPLRFRLPKVIEAVVPHHTAVWGKGWRQHYNFHVGPRQRFTSGRWKGEWMGRGWPICAYHLYVARDGQVYVLGNLEHVGFHCGNEFWNIHSVGIVIEGNFAERAPTDVQLVAAAEAVIWLENQLDRRLNILWHEDLKYPEPYSCPGKYFPKEAFTALVDSYYATPKGAGQGPEDSPKINVDIDYPTPLLSPEQPKVYPFSPDYFLRFSQPNKLL